MPRKFAPPQRYVIPRAPRKIIILSFNADTFSTRRVRPIDGQKSQLRAPAWSNNRNVVKVRASVLNCPLFPNKQCSWRATRISQFQRDNHSSLLKTTGEYGRAGHLTRGLAHISGAHTHASGTVLRIVVVEFYVGPLTLPRQMKAPFLRDVARHVAPTRMQRAGLARHRARDTIMRRLRNGTITETRSPHLLTSSANYAAAARIRYARNSPR